MQVGDELNTQCLQRGLVTTELGRLPTVTDDQFRNATDNLDKQLDTLEGLVKNAGTEVDKIKR